MFIEILGENEDIIEVDSDFALSDQVLEYVVHHPLEGGWGIGETKEHYSGFKKSTVHPERSFLLISFLDLDIVVSPANIKFGEILGALELVNEFRDEGEWVAVFDRHFVQLAVVLYGTEQAILLFDEEEGQSEGGFGGVNSP